MPRRILPPTAGLDMGLARIVFALGLVLSHAGLAEGDASAWPWFVGQRVVCVYNGYLDLSDAPELTEGKVYSVDAVLPRKNGHYGLVVTHVMAKTAFQAFDERRFKPLLSDAELR